MAGMGSQRVRFQLRLGRPPCAFRSLSGAALLLSSSEGCPPSTRGEGDGGSLQASGLFSLQEIPSCCETTCREQAVFCRTEVGGAVERGVGHWLFCREGWSVRSLSAACPNGA